MQQTATDHFTNKMILRSLFLVPISLTFPFLHICFAS